MVKNSRITGLIMILFLLPVSFFLMAEEKDQASIGIDSNFTKPESKGNVKIIGRRIFLNSKPFFIKGAGYQPIPVGENVNYPVYFQKEIYERDLSLLRAIGCNTIRTWNAAISKEFLDACYNNGIKPIYVVTGPYFSSDNANLAETNECNKIIDEWTKFIRQFKDHPAILMWQFGNEANFWYKHDIKDYYKFADSLAKIVYELEGEKYHPFSLCNGGIHYKNGVIGDPALLTDDASMNYVDVWGVNLYTGRSFKDIFEEYFFRSKKPLWLSEYGCDALDNRTGKEYQDTHAAFVMDLTRELINYNDIVSGGSIMAYSDEWWKRGDPLIHNLDGWQSEVQPDGVSNEEWYGIVAVEKQPDKVDKIIPRKLYYMLGKIWKKDFKFKDISKRKITLTKEEVFGFKIKDIQAKHITPGETVNRNDITNIEVSSYRDENTMGKCAIDGNLETRWESVHNTDPSWILFELKEVKMLTGIYIHWEIAAAKKYKIEVSTDKKTWMEAAKVNNGREGQEREIYFDPVRGKYIRIFCEERTTPYGYSIWETIINPSE